MIINHTHKFIFIHVPKCAGMTTTQLLSKYSRYCDLEIGGTKLGEDLQHEYLERYGLRKHSTPAEIRSVVGEEVWTSYFKFTIVRHPVSRAVSAYKFLQRWRLWDDSEMMDRFHSVNEFVQSEYWKTDGQDRLLVPQVDFLSGGVDFIGQFESFDASFDRALELIGLPPITDRNVIFPNEAPRVKKVDRLTERSLDLIKNRYQRDFETYGYDPEST